MMGLTHQLFASGLELHGILLMICAWFFLFTGWGLAFRFRK